MSRPDVTGVVAEPLDDVVDAVRRLADELGLALDESTASNHSSTFATRSRSRLGRSSIVVGFEAIQPARTRVVISVRSSGVAQRRRGRRLANAVLDGISALRPLSWNG